MRYELMTYVAPEEVLRRARDFYSEHTRLRVTFESPDSLRLEGDIGTATIRVDRQHGQTNVHAETDRVAGLDVTDVTKRFLYTLEHV